MSLSLLYAVILRVPRVESRFFSSMPKAVRLFETDPLPSFGELLSARSILMNLLFPRD
jgi:hypothetical protein